jgi:mannose-6-phosphate isomerase-like protein (cupin superfamily)
MNGREDMNTEYVLKDYGPQPLVLNIEKATKQNRTFRTALWTGTHLQVTLMSINAGEDIGVERHSDLDQFLRIEQGQGLVKMGNSRDNMTMQAKVSDDDAIIVPAGTWHNLITRAACAEALLDLCAAAASQRDGP